MCRHRLAFLGLLFLLVGMAQMASAADSPAKGNWKIYVPVPTREKEETLNIMVMFSESKGKWVGDVLDSTPPFNVEPVVKNLVVQDDIIKFEVHLGQALIYSFDGKFEKDGKKLKGSLVANRTMLVEFYPTKLKNFKDEFAMAKEALDQQDGAEFFTNLVQVLHLATKKGLKPEEVRTYCDRAMKDAEQYGNRWQRTVASGIAGTLADQEAFAPIALEQARQAERMLTDKDDALSTLLVLDTLSKVLKKAKKFDEAKKIDLQITKTEARDFADYTKKSPFNPEAYAGRKAKSDHVCLVELFTGADCPKCVASDLAFDGLDKTYKPADVVLLEYHVHIPNPDPMTNKDGETRALYYDVQSAPCLYVDGKVASKEGGGFNQARAKYKAYREIIEEQLEKPSEAKLQLTASLKGSDVVLNAKVDDLKKPGEKVMLRFAVTEERVRYAGGNGLRYSHSVVRAMPGGSKGFPMAKAAGSQEVKMNLDELRASLNKSLDDFSKENMFEFEDRPFNLRNLKAVAFLQDDASKEILQAVQVDLEEK